MANITVRQVKSKGEVLTRFFEEHAPATAEKVDAVYVTNYGALRLLSHVILS